jgi:rhodanese-related sulfurtransferase
MYKFIGSAMMILFTFQLNAQYKNDNVLYKTVYPEDLSQQLKDHPGYLLLDVRSKGENQDTSSMQGLNIGHFKDAKNIDIRELPGRLNELQGFKNTPIFVYCSHSQRSRRASRILADSGFTNVYNINGGMTTLLQKDYGLKNIYETKDEYQLIGPATLCNELSSKSSYIIDVREDSSYNGSTGNEMTNSIGKMKSAVHIQQSDLQKSLSSLPKSKKIILIDDYGDESIKAAKTLTDAGYKNIEVLFDGLYNVVTTNPSELACKNQLLMPNKNYHVVTADEFHDMEAKSPDITILDIRNSADFENKSKDYWRNVGRIKNAINVPGSELQNRLTELSSYKNKHVVVYGFGSSEDAYKAASTLTANGFTNVDVLAGGIFSIRWRAANIKGKSYLKDLVTDIPAQNM